MKNKALVFFLFACMSILFSGCSEDDIVNYAKDLPGVYKSLSGDVKVDGAVNVITIYNTGGSNALSKKLVIKITDKDTQTIAGVKTVRYSTNNNDVKISRVGAITTLTISSSNYVSNPTGIYIGTKQ